MSRKNKEPRQLDDFSKMDLIRLLRDEVELKTRMESFLVHTHLYIAFLDYSNDMKRVFK